MSSWPARSSSSMPATIRARRTRALTARWSSGRGRSSSRGSRSSAGPSWGRGRRRRVESRARTCRRPAGAAVGGAGEQAAATDVTAAARTAHRAVVGRRRRLGLGRIVRAYPRRWRSSSTRREVAGRSANRYVAAVTTEPIPIVLDVDTGVDDACALLLAALHPALDLRAVSCVGGNAPVDDVVRNTLLVLETAGRTDVPVARGAERPLLETPVDARHVHGDDGMGDLGWPAAAADGRPAPRRRAAP